MNNYLETVTAPKTTDSVQGSAYCASRLPCGVCLITGQRCPLFGWDIQPTWISTTECCNVKDTEL